MKEIRKYLISTFVLTYLSWGIATVYTQVNNVRFGSSIFMIILYIIGVIAPAICAIAIKKQELSKEKFKDFLKNILYPSKCLTWYILIVIIILILNFIPFLIFDGIKRAPIYMIVLQLPLFILIGGLEEVGWRGILLPNLQNKFTPFMSTLIVGIIWTFWHLPLFFIIGTYQELYLNFFTFMLQVIAFSFILSVVYNRTKSIFMCIFCHALSNAFAEVFVVDKSLISNGMLLLISIIIFLWFYFISKKKLLNQSI